MERFTTVDGESVNTITFAEPIHTRYIKMQGVSLNGNNTFKLREFEAYEAVDRTALKEQVKAAKEKCEEFGLTFADAKGYDAFMDAYMKAEAMYENALAEQNDVNAAASTLKEALESIQDKPNPKPEAYKSKLEELYKECFEAYKEVDYTKDSWNDFLEAMKKTDTVLKDENVTQEDVDAAKAALEDAVNRLEKVSEAMETGVLQAKTEEIQRTCAVWISKVVCNQWNRVFLLSK